MEASFEHDFGRVRIHDEGSAAELTGSHQALALTAGSDVFLAPEAPSLATPPGRLVLAHELAHVVQNERTAGSPTARVSNLEREAAAASLKAVTGARARVGLSGDGAPLALSKGWKYLLYGLGGAALGGLVGLGAAAVGLVGGGLGLVGGLLGGLGLGLTAAFASERKQQERQQLRAQRQQIDLWIEGSYGDELPDHVTPDQALRANWEVVSDDEFQRVYEAWGQSDTPWFRVGGFVNRSSDPPTILIRRRHNNPFVRLHEAVHLYAHPSMRIQSRFLREGATDFFSRQIAGPQGIAVTSDYDPEFRVVDRLVDLVGEEPLRRAFFDGDIRGLQQAVEAAGLDWVADVLQGGLADREPPRPRPVAPAPRAE